MQSTTRTRSDLRPALKAALPPLWAPCSVLHSLPPSASHLTPSPLSCSSWVHVQCDHPAHPRLSPDSCWDPTAGSHAAHCRPHDSSPVPQDDQRFAGDKFISHYSQMRPQPHGLTLSACGTSSLQQQELNLTLFVAFSFVFTFHLLCFYGR